MVTFLIIVAIIVVLISILLSLDATFTIIYDKKWTTKIKILWIEKDIPLSKILSFVMFPEQKAEEIKNSDTDKEVDNKKELNNTSTDKEEKKKKEEKDTKKSKPNFFKKIWDKDGIVGIMSFASNMIESLNSAVTTFFRVFHIYSLYVKIIVGGNDASDIAEAYGTICKYYYPLKGAILNGMTVDEYDDLVQPDFIAPVSEYGLLFIGSISVKMLLKIVFKALNTFLKNLIKK